ncbi:hypothetical protein [Nocardiopsis synnemataformans]|uniref:hypothetical protein n=1 Tax=Nocardiopsis synnemataformans TaxID=61305 RepID=UPI003EBA5DBD
MSVDKQGARKNSGSYYTPENLVHLLVVGSQHHDQVERMKAEGNYRPISGVLTELIHERLMAGGDPEQVLLGLTVCDPCAGAGVFLLSAVDTITAWLVMVRSGELNPPAPVWDQARRDVVERCIYGVDLNPIAVDLTRAALHVRALLPHTANPFLAHHVRHGNGLVGATPKQIKDGVPDVAFTAIEGDDPKVAAALRRQNKAERARRAETSTTVMDGPAQEGLW